MRKEITLTSIIMRILLVIILAAGIASCKQTHCPAFPPSLLNYFPYTKGETLKFQNQNNDTLALVINKNWSSDSYSFDWNCKCSCGANAGFETEMDTSFLVKVNGTIDISNDTKVSIINFYISDDKISSDDFFYRIDGVNPFLEENYSLFGDTIFFENDEYYRYNNLLVIKKKGIIEFWDKKESCTWVIIE